MISLKKVNNSNIKPIKLKKVDDKLVKGGDILPLYPNIYICAKKNSGKTTITSHILKHCLDKNSNVFFFVSTIYIDPSYKAICKMLDKKGINYTIYNSIMEDKKNNLEEILNNLEIDDYSDSDSDSDEIMEYQPNYNFLFYNEKEYKYKPKKIACKNVFIFDDISAELKNPMVAYLCKKNRHMRAKVILNSQYLNDLRPETIMNLDIVMLGKSMSGDKLREIYNRLDLSVDYDLFKSMYEMATEEPYQFFKIDVRKERFYKNFNKEFEIA